MSKRFKGKTCVYCATAPAATMDHVFAREFFLVDRRANLPKVPACAACNGAKSNLEHYLTAVLPFGGRHADGLVHLTEMVPGRLAPRKGWCGITGRFCCHQPLLVSGPKCLAPLLPHQAPLLSIGPR